MKGLTDDYAQDDFEEMEKLTTQNRLDKARPSVE